MQVVCLDLEGVLIPEIWIAFAEKTQVQELKRTTRDEPDYKKLMDYRLGILDKNGFTLPQIQEVIETLEPLPGAVEFLAKLRASHELIILSDTFREFALPLINKLGNPTLFCHELQVSESGRIEEVKLRLADHKRKTVQYLQKLNFEVIASGDSYNDLGMLLSADRCSFFKPPTSLTVEYPDIEVARNYDSLYQFIQGS
ncbi:bifunctional phosphoserine phosphatase/homoserine phosphotransferase ThrH [Candidatus Chordibacter forsetii]|jgi:phosphoserine / homoserine phosphotransferase|uniref:bifunctional phosphoserine phosphatase/homoserine phosphotransferase ThrH n=1 Tax=Candidatus Chordibacter forsetii TaxID=3381758 RepID=UPI00231DF2E4|nr:bifunctional phosphoserine phosphatase/homoserine phosphotransferase ThrH [Opitutales bacterium]